MGQNVNYWKQAYYDRYVKEATELGLPIKPIEQFDAVSGENANFEEQYQNFLIKEKRDAALKTEQERPKTEAYAGLDAALKGGYITQKNYDNLKGMLDSNIDPNTVNTQLQKVWGQTEETVDAGADTGIEDTEAPKYEFEMPTEWQTIEDYANTVVKKGRPELGATDIQKQADIIDPLYEGTRKSLEQRQRDQWGMLFSQGGGTGKQASEDLEAFSNLELDKLNKAISFAKAEKSEDLAEFLTAQKMLQDIGSFKATAGQFTSAQEAANYWNTISQKWDEYRTGVAQDQSQQALDTSTSQFQQSLQNEWQTLLQKRTWAEEDWTKYADLTKQTAQIQADAGKSDFWEDLLKGAVSGAAKGYGYAAAAG